MGSRGISRLAMLLVGALVAAGLAVASPAAAAGPVVYVDAAAIGVGDGSSWTDAFTDLQDALAVVSPGDEIHVAEGTYTPDASDRNVTFELVDDVDLIGGYQSGGAAGPDPALYPTILSGDLAGDDLPGFVNNEENSLHVVTAGDTIVTGLRFDGLVVRGGNANGSASNFLGGGLVLNGAENVTIVDSSFMYNTADGQGGGLLIWDSTSVDVVDATFSFNNASHEHVGCDYTGGAGGGIAVIDSVDVSISGAVVTYNSASELSSGGGMYLECSSVVVSDSLIANNTASSSGGGIETGIASTVIERTTITDNEAVYSGGGLSYDTSLGGAYLVDSIVSNNTAGAGGGGGMAVSGDSVVHTVNTSITGNAASIGGGVLNGSYLTSTIVNSDISGNTASNAGGGIYSEEWGGSTIVNSTIANNSASVGGGIFSEDFGGSTITNSTIADNDAAAGGAGIYHSDAGGSTIRNSIVWGNTPDAVFGGSATPIVTNSDVEGWTGGGVGNIDADPLFVGAGDYRLQPGSPARDAGDNAAVPADQYDVDGDADTTEPTPDLDLQDRIWGPTVDMGAYEFSSLPVAVGGVASVVEGNVGSKLVQVPLNLSFPSPLPVTVDWTTADWTAAAPGDYVAASGTVTFAPGETAKSVPVSVKSDALYETDEILGVIFSNPTNATVGGFLGLGLAVITNDDAQPTAAIGGFVATEGDRGTTSYDLPITLSAPAGVPVSIDWATEDLPTNPRVAHPGSDFVAASGTVTFAPGETVKNIRIDVIGDTDDEPPLLYGEWGLVRFTNPVNTVVTGGLFGLGLFIIIDDDVVDSTYRIRMGSAANAPMLDGASFPANGSIVRPYLRFSSGDVILDGEGNGVDWYIDEVLFRDGDWDEPFRISNVLPTLPIGTPFSGDYPPGSLNEFLLTPGEHTIRADAAYPGGTKQFIATFTVEG